MSAHVRQLLTVFKKKIFADTFLYMTANLISQGIGFLALPIFTRYLSPEDYGIFNYTNAIKAFLTAFAALSLNSFVLKHYFTLKTERERRVLLGTVYYSILIFNFFLFLIAYLIFPNLIDRFGIQTPFYPYFLIMLAINFFETLLVIPLVNFRVKKQVRRFFWMSALSAILTVGIGLVLVVIFKMGLVGRMYGILAANALFAVIGLIVILKSADTRIDFSMLKKGLLFSLPILPGALASMGTASTDRIILERFISIDQLGIYSVGLTLGTIIMIVIRAFYRAIEPDIYESFGTTEFNAKMVQLKNRFLLIITLMGGLMIIFSREIVMLMVAPQFYSCYLLIPFFVIASLFRGAKTLPDTALYALNKTHYEPVLIAFSLALNLGLNLLLIPRFGIYGAATAVVLTFWLGLFLSTSITGHLSGIRWGFLKDNFLIWSICGVSCALMVAKIGNLWITLLVKLSLVAILLFGLLKSKLLLKTNEPS